MNRILVATDLSIRSDRAVDRAVRIAARLKVGLTAIHVVDSAMPDDLADMVRTEAKARLQRFVSTRPGAETVDIDVICEIGDPGESIHEAARIANAGLLVVGSHRPRAFLDSVRETTMERLVRTSSKPVLLVTDASDHDYAKVLAAVDMSPACTRAINAAHQLVPSAEFSLFHGLYIPFPGLTGDAASEERMAPYVAEADAAIDDWLNTSVLPAGLPRPSIIEGGPATACDAATSESRPDLLVVGLHSRGRLGRRILGSFTADLVRNPPRDLLIAR